MRIKLNDSQQSLLENLEECLMQKLLKFLTVDYPFSRPISSLQHCGPPPLQLRGRSYGSNLIIQQRRQEIRIVLPRDLA